MIPVLQFVVLTLTGADVSAEDQSSLLQAQAFQKRAAAADVVDSVALAAQQSKSAGLEGATADKKKVEGATKGKRKGKGKSKSPYKGYELLGDGACLQPVAHDSLKLDLSPELLMTQDRCIETCSQRAAAYKAHGIGDDCTGISFAQVSQNGVCQLHHTTCKQGDVCTGLRGWKQDAAVCEHLAADDLSTLKRLDGTCFHEVAFGNGARCHDCEVLYKNFAYEKIIGLTSEDEAQRCSDAMRDLDAARRKTFRVDRLSGHCEVWFVHTPIINRDDDPSTPSHISVTKDGWGRAGSCYKKM